MTELFRNAAVETDFGRSESILANGSELRISLEPVARK